MNKLNGLIIIVLLSVVSNLIHQFIVPSIETLTIGIIVGIVVENIFHFSNTYLDSINFSLKKILKWGIVLLGVKLNFNYFLELGIPTFILIVTLITLAITLSMWLGKRLKLNKKASALIGVGSSICGASAIVAMAPVIEANEEDTSIAVSVISLLGAIGVMTYTGLSTFLPLSDIQFGVFSGTTLQGVSHALAAAGARGSLSLEIGTMVKMARVVALVPVAIILSSTFKTQSSKKVSVPYYVVWFILVGIVVSINQRYQMIPVDFTIREVSFNLISILKSLSSYFILMAMIGMGMKINFKSIKKESLYALLTGTIVFLSLSLVGFIFITLFI